MNTTRTTTRTALTAPTAPAAPAAGAPATLSSRLKRAARVAGAVALAAAALALPVASASPASAQTATTTTAATAPVEQQLFAGSLWATLALENHAGFTVPAFDGNAFSLTGAFAKTRGNVVRFHGFQKTTLAAIQSAAIEVRLGHANWVDDQVALEYSVDGWRTAHVLASFTRATPLPSSVTALRFEGLQGVIATPALANAVEVRLRSVSATGKADVVTFTLDQVALTVTGS